MTVEKPIDRSKRRPPPAGHPWKSGSFDAMTKHKKLNQERQKERGPQ